MTTNWYWPINLESYDRYPLLYESEQSDLAAFTKQYRKPSYLVQLARSFLSRLITPVEDALVVVGVRADRRNYVLCQFLQEMDCLQKPFWAWTDEEWLDLFNRSVKIRQGQVASCNHFHQLAVSYLLTGFTDFYRSGRTQVSLLADRIFGRPVCEQAVQQATDALIAMGYGAGWAQGHLSGIVRYTLLLNRSPFLKDITLEQMEVWREKHMPPYCRKSLFKLSYALYHLGILSRPLEYIEPEELRAQRERETLEGISSEWVNWCQRWRDTSTGTLNSVHGYYCLLLKIGRWLYATHPEVTHPGQWTRELAAEYVAAVNRMRVGDWTIRYTRADKGKPISMMYRAHLCTVMRMFFRDCQSWGWIPIRFDPGRSFVTPREVRTQMVPKPRVIADDMWAKLVWAGLNVDQVDLPRPRVQTSHGQPAPIYPLELVRAVAITWLFAGLRSDELVRLRVGCISWEEVQVEGATRQVCLLNVPAHKTGAPFTKPVDSVVGEAINLWQASRPDSLPMLDPKTGEKVQYLFVCRGRRVSKHYINNALIPLLCQKAGIPAEDAKGSITSHRARSTIATQLFNAKEPMSLFDLQAWLGHRSPNTTQYYARITPTRLAKSYADAEYFRRNLRMVEVLIDQEAVHSGEAAAGAPWKFYDLGHGYCTYDFFDQCPHRMACAKCTFYRPKESSQAQLLEANVNLQRMLQEIPLTPDEQAAVEDGLSAVARLAEKLVDVATPAGPTPRQLLVESGSVIPLRLIQCEGGGEKRPYNERREQETIAG